MAESTATTTVLRWSIEQRLAFIDRRLYWDGQINRSDLVDRFGVSVPQASADLSRYEKASKGNMAYDLHAKSYLVTDEFTPRVDPNAREYLAQLHLIADDVLKPEESWIGKLPEFATVPRVRRRLGAEVLRRLVQAMRANLGVEISYQSLQASKPTKRWITPHAMSFDGQRWHARSWCHQRGRFLDFVLARIFEVHQEVRSSIDASKDLAWHTQATVRLGPNPALPPSQRHAVALDYGMRDNVVEIPVRLCLVYYLNRQLLLDVADRLNPERVPLVVLNADELNRELERVGEALI